MIETKDIPEIRLIDEMIDRSRDKDGDGIDDEDERLLEGYEMPKHTSDKWFKKVIDWTEAAVLGSNTAGRVIGGVLDVGASIAPAGSKINKLRKGVKGLLKTKQKVTMSEQPKSKVSSKTIIAFGLVFLVGLLEHLGVNLGLELSTDAEWVAIGTGVVGIILRLITSKPVKLGKALTTILRQKEAQDVN